MEPGTAAVVGFLSALAIEQEKLRAFAEALRSRPGIRSAQLYRFSPSAFEANPFESESSRSVGSDFGVSVDLEDGAAIDWWFELWHSGDAWRVQSAIHRHDS
jgi:hypothetical protein